MEDLKQGWDLFSPEVAWFIHDFFRFKLKPTEKLLFYGYYVMGFTLEELAERLHCSFQNVSSKIKKINGKLKTTWNTKENWRSDGSN